jgi:hypothetical protein
VIYAYELGAGGASLDRRAHAEAIARDLRRWPRTADMLRDASIVETAGAV